MNAQQREFASAILTPRLALIPASREILRADLAGRDALARELGVAVSDEWPPDLYDSDAIHWAIRAMEREPAAANWLTHYFVLREQRGGAPSLLVGAGGFKGLPDDTGTVEIGYSIITSHRRQGLATEAARGFLRHAFGDPRVWRATAETLPDLVASIGVMEKIGMHLSGAGSEPGVIRFEITREEYEGSASALPE